MPQTRLSLAAGKGGRLHLRIAGCSKLPVTTLNQAIRSDGQLRCDDRGSVESYIRPPTLAGHRPGPISDATSFGNSLAQPPACQGSQNQGGV